MTDAQFNAWLKDQAAIRCILVEVGVKSGGVEITRYLSNRGYVTSPSDTPANTTYAARIVGGVSFTESISIDGSVAVSYGDIELQNLDGALDPWLDDYWSNRILSIYVGDMSWPREDFRLVFNGVVSGIDAKNRDRLNLKISDKLQRLNTPVSEVKLGGSSTNADQLIPLCFGECHNIEPLLVDSAYLEYQVHDGQIERIIEVRDNGIPVAFTPFLSTGKFRLVNNPVGQITCSVQGDKYGGVYKNDVVGVVTRLATGYGSSTLRFTSGDLNASALAVFAAANTQPVGAYLKDRANTLEVCNQIAASVGARLVVSKAGLLSLVKIDLGVSSTRSVNADDMAERSIEIKSLPTVLAAVKLAYCKNYTVQDSLASGVLAEHAEMFKQEWLTVTRTDSAAATNYNLFTEPTQQDTLLLVASDAIAEANRRLNLFKTQRRVIKFRGFPRLLLTELGTGMTITHSRFGLSTGKTGQVISVASDWVNMRVDIEVLI